jgi:NAD(P)-dependent dehydrogenase (short-subunit alcohol dehydrogenase family)
MRRDRAGVVTVVLVTGANSGIGSAAVLALVRRGAHVVATVRSDEAEQELHDALRAAPSGIEVTVERMDVTDASTVAEVIRRRRPEVVVNNAGSALLGAVSEVDDDAAAQQFETMVLAPVRIAREAIGTGSCRRVVDVGSIVADGVIPFTGWYAASKAALDALTDVWRMELAPRGVELVSVECGAVATDAWDEAGDTVAGGDDPSTSRARARWAELTSVVEPRFVDPAVVGEAIADAALGEDPPATTRVGFGSGAGRLLQLVPRRLREAVTGVVLGLRSR